MGKFKLKIATIVTGHRSSGKIETKDRRRREGGMAIFSEQKIADSPGLCVASLTSAITTLLLFCVWEYWMTLCVALIHID